MSRLDDAIREALRREDPGPEFTARVLAAAAGAQPKQTWWQAFVSSLHPGRWRWATAGALACALVIGGSIEYHNWQGRQAKAKLVLALRIAGSKLNVARDRVQQLNAGD